MSRVNIKHGGDLVSDYKKSYKGFTLWLIGFCAASVLCIFLPEKIGTQILIAIIDNVITIGCFVLAFMIYKNGAVYWYNSTSYEDALAAGAERRKNFALKHMKRFEYFALFFLIYSIVSIWIGIPYGIDFTIAVVGIIAVAVSTINIKL